MVDLITLLENGTLSECDESMLLEAEYDIAVMRAEKEYLYEAGLASIDTMFNESGDEKQDSAFKKFLEKVFNAATKVIQGVLSAISNLFKKEHITEDEFFHSETFYVMVDHDYKKIVEKVDDEVRKSSSLIQKIAKGTHKDDAVVEKTVKSLLATVSDIRKSDPVNLSLIGSPMSFIENNIELPIKKNQDDLKVLYDVCIKEISKRAHDKKAEEQMRKLYNATTSLLTASSLSLSSVAKQIVSKQPDSKDTKKSKKKD